MRCGETCVRFVPVLEDTLYLFHAVSNWHKKTSHTKVKVFHPLMHGLSLTQSSSLQRITRRVEELEQLAVQRKGTYPGLTILDVS